jgi:hypothetical protein
MTVAVRWSNGQVDRAASWDELLENIRVDQFSEWPTDEFKAVLATRAYRWTGAKVDTDLPAEQFFVELAWAKLIEIVNDEKGAK